MIAIGQGGVTGKGVAGATQTRLDYLPEHATDFVFSVVGEERGFVGAAWLLALYMLLVWRGSEADHDLAHRRSAAWSRRGW